MPALWLELRRSFFRAGALLAALAALRPAATEADAAPKLTADDYIEIQVTTHPLRRYDSGVAG